MLVLGMSDNLRGPLFFEILKTYNISDTMGSLLFSGSAIMGFLSCLASIPILKKFSYTQLLSFSLFLFTIGLWGMSQSPNFAVLIFFTGVMGSAMGFMGVAQNSLVALAPQQYRTKAMSGMHSMYGVASFLAPLSVGIGLDAGLDWKNFFFITGFLPLVLFVSSYYWVKDNSLGSLEENKTDPTKPINGQISKKIVLACGLLGFYVIAEILVGSRLSLYSIREFGISSSEASRYVTGFFLGLLSGRVFGAFFQWPGSASLQLSVSLVLSFFTLNLGLYANPWFFTLTGLCMSLFYPVCSSYMAQLFRGQEGVLFSYLIGIQSLLIVIMHVVVGKISDIMGLKFAFHMAFVFLLVSGICLWRIEIENRKES